MTEYTLLIEGMTWSYSRIKSFYDCHYRWFLRYILGLKGEETFFASYGSFIHRLIEQYYKKKTALENLPTVYLTEFREAVRGEAPSEAVFKNYFLDGFNYFKSFAPLPYRPLAAEKKVEFKLNGHPFVGYIDFLGERDGGICVVDNKSRSLKPRSKRARPTKTDAELDSYLKQLYLYSIPITEEYGVAPKLLCLNCFRVPLLIEETYNAEACCAATGWAEKGIDDILNTTDFEPDIDYFKCNYLCEMRNHCEYYAMNFAR